MNSSVLNNYTESLRQRRSIETVLAHAREDLKARQSFITPTGADYKALGTNDTDRENVMLRRFMDDAPCVEMKAHIRDLEVSLSLVNADIDEIEAQRRNEEWDITRLLADALLARVGGRNPGREAVLLAATQETRDEAARELAAPAPEDPYPFESEALPVEENSAVIIPF